ncbi:MAG: hypothetical protein QOF20_2993 [Acidimicrobiaceae bacterium]|nr:hypothetical protein [Acidimicrobiaceae bacterium]
MDFWSTPQTAQPVHLDAWRLTGLGGSDRDPPEKTPPRSPRRTVSAAREGFERPDAEDRVRWVGAGPGGLGHE